MELGSVAMKRQEFDFNLDETFPPLESAPIVEAVIHWLAKPSKTLEALELKNQLAERLPDYPQILAEHDVRIAFQTTLNLGSAEPPKKTERHATWRGFRLTSTDNAQIVKFNSEGVSVSRLAPYGKWETFVNEGLRMWDMFLELAEPLEVQRLGVRFINRINLPDAGSFQDFLANPPKCLEPLGLPLYTFLYQSTHDVPGYPYRIRAAQTVQPPSPPQRERHGLVVDIDVFTTTALPAREANLTDHLARMRWLKNKTFFSLVSKRAIKSFQKAEQ
jgi:uncharacterized protein (TIGR04255 family)